MPPSSSSSPPPCEISTGMAITLSPSYYIAPFIFKFLKSIDLQSMGLRIDSIAHLLPYVQPSHTTLREEILVHEPFMIESREMGDESLSTDEFLGSENVRLKHFEEFVLNDDPISEY